MDLCATLQDHLYVEMGLRCQDEDVPVFSFSRERGKDNHEPHINGHYDLSTNETDKPRLAKREHAELKKILDAATDMPYRLVLRMVHPNNRTYGYGYDMKDLVRRRCVLCCCSVPRGPTRAARRGTHHCGDPCCCV